MGRRIGRWNHWNKNIDLSLGGFFQRGHASSIYPTRCSPLIGHHNTRVTSRLKLTRSNDSSHAKSLSSFQVLLNTFTALLSMYKF
jgi:hypothetical protein